METSEVSIVLPIWKKARYLGHSLESCLSQTFRRLEVIVVDDGCEAAARATAEAFVRQDKRVRIVTHGNNRGLPAALNTGFAVSLGKYLTWTSDDNSYRPQAIQTLVGALEANSAVGMVYSDHNVVDPEGRLIERRTAADFRNLIFQNCIGGCFLYRREVHLKLGGYAEELFLAEDYDFWLRASAHFTLAPIHEELYDSREHSGSLSARQARGADAMARRCVAKNLPLLPWVTTAEKAAAYLMLARAAQSAGDWREARHHAVSGFQLAPLAATVFAARKIWARTRPRNGQPPR